VYSEYHRKACILAFKDILFETFYEIFIIFLITGEKRLKKNKNGNLIPIFILVPNSFLVCFGFLFIFVFSGSNRKISYF